MARKSVGKLYFIFVQGVRDATEKLNYVASFTFLFHFFTLICSQFSFLIVIFL